MPQAADPTGRYHAAVGPIRPPLNMKFLKGPVDWAWIAEAARLPGKALEVGLCIWRLVGVMKSGTILLSTVEVEALGVDRYAKSRALKALQRAGLITFESRRGRFPRVTLISEARPSQDCHERHS